MKLITLTQGKVAIVSACDYTFLKQWKWCYRNSKHGGYAGRAGPRPRKKIIWMHKVVATRKGLRGQIDHANQNKLDNQRRNLRPATHRQNCTNRGKQSNNTSGYKGVSWSKWAHKWRATITVEKRNIHLGYFKDKKSAALRYNHAALQHYGRFAAPNPV